MKKDKAENKKLFSGKIMSKSMNGVVVVDLQRVKTHPLYGKKYKANNRLKARNKKFNVEIGDVVNIVAIRPSSKETHFEIVSLEKK